jgi:shikimate 5-dehydrogenase
MPFKTKILKYIDEKTPEVESIGAANTIINQNGYLKAYNTDWLGVYNYLLENLPNGLGKATLYILGNGGFSKATQYACDKLKFDYKVITRENWNLVPNIKGITINCTPVKVITDRGILIDGRPTSNTGKMIAHLQALEQYKIYTDET